MSLLEVMLVIFTVTFSNVIVFFLCNKNNEKVELNPKNVYKKVKENKEQEEKYKYQKKVDEINLKNIDNYNPNGLGQEDFPSKDA